MADDDQHNVPAVEDEPADGTEPQDKSPESDQSQQSTPADDNAAAQSDEKLNKDTAESSPTEADDAKQDDGSPTADIPATELDKADETPGEGATEASPPVDTATESKTDGDENVPADDAAEAAAAEEVTGEAAGEGEVTEPAVTSDAGAIDGAEGAADTSAEAPAEETETPAAETTPAETTEEGVHPEGASEHQAEGAEETGETQPSETKDALEQGASVADTAKASSGSEITAIAEVETEEAEAGTTPAKDAKTEEVADEAAAIPVVHKESDFFDVEELEERELTSPPQPISPTPQEESPEVEIPIEEETPQYDREQLIEKYNQAISEQHELREKNQQLQHKLADFFRRKKPDESRQEVSKNTNDQEQRYIKYMSNLDELRNLRQQKSESYSLEIAELKDRCEEKQGIVEDARQRYTDFKRQIASHAIFGRSGKSIMEKDVDQHLQNEEKKESEVVNVRLENIKLKNNLKKKEQQLKSKEELAAGLHLIDFEQLKIENQTYNEKIEERNEELMKLRKKITSTVQVLTHLKEKLQFVQAETHVQKRKLYQVEDEVAKKRDMLSRTKQSRDSLRIDNQKLRQNCGLLGNMHLLRDYEERKDEADELRGQIEKLSMVHAELTLNLNGVRRKINQAKAATGS